jgi:hypothetical protein
VKDPPPLFLWWGSQAAEALSAADAILHEENRELQAEVRRLAHETYKVISWSGAATGIPSPRVPSDKNSNKRRCGTSRYFCSCSLIAPRYQDLPHPYPLTGCKRRCGALQETEKRTRIHCNRNSHVVTASLHSHPSPPSGIMRPPCPIRPTNAPPPPSHAHACTCPPLLPTHLARPPTPSSPPPSGISRPPRPFGPLHPRARAHLFTGLIHSLITRRRGRGRRRPRRYGR